MRPVWRFFLAGLSLPAAAALTRALNGFSFRERLLADRPGVHVLAFSRKDEVRLAAWIQGRKSRRVVIPSAQGRYKIVGHKGDLAGLIEAGEKGIEIELTASPVYILPEK